MNSQSSNPYPDVSSRPDFPAIERSILQRWEREGTFQASIDQRESESNGGSEYVFNDGPPFANGLPHYGHLLTGYVKDVIPRYQTMRGNRVDRRFGWDCHGLPAEMESEKELGVAGRKAILDFGIDKFNDHCQTSVLRYTKEWEQYVTRQARWVDFDSDYKTMDLDYMESVIWAFKQLWDKGLIYEAHRVMPYSWGAETPLANFEIRLDDATRPRQDPAVTVAFTLEPAATDPGPLAILAWTTTPWTLPSNLALAVGPDIDYVVVDDPNQPGRYVIMAEAALARYSKELGEVEPVAKMKGNELVERRYTPLFPYFKDHPQSFRVLGADFVETGNGTGVVHMAPGFGEDDQRVCEAEGIELVVPVDDEGRFTEEVTDFAGMNVFEANPEIIKTLKGRDKVLRHETYDHNYPHCWRTDTPIIYRAISSWYVSVTSLTDQLLEANSQINWIPDHVRDGQFGKWLEGARDWSVSRNRFWGAPIPIWRSDNPEFPRVDVYGSLDELEKDFGVRPENLHRPYIDDLVRPNPDDPSGQSMMRRVPEVLDCWFESGSMPYAQHHYPFENVEFFEKHNPADFIVEYIAQTRGWFYTMHVLSVALFDRPAFSNVICHGVVLDSEGQKLSKKLRNYPDPLDIFETIGSDALRWRLISSPILRGLDLSIDRDGEDVRAVVRQILNPIWNAYSFFTLYANADGYRAKHRVDSEHLLDRYILAKTHDLVVEATGQLDAYDLAGASATVHGFLDALTNWYIRRSRERFWNAEAGDVDTDALDTLYTVLTTLMKVAAPLLPFTTEEIWTGLTSDGSLHLQSWPEADLLPADPDLVKRMDRLRETASAALRLRDDSGHRIRQPLAKIILAGGEARIIEPFSDLLADEVNVKSVEFSDDIAEYGEFVLQPNGRVLGPRLGSDVQTVIKTAKQGNWSLRPDGSVDVAGHILSDDDFELNLRPLEGVTAASLPGNQAVVVLDVEITPELEAEGLARDLVRLVQQERKDRDLNVTDRISLKVHAPDTLTSSLEPHIEWIKSQVLAVDLSSGVELRTSGKVGDHSITFDFDVVTAVV